jgi:hypothetical protein
MGIETAALVAAVAATTVSAGAAIYSGAQQKSAAKAQANQVNADAEAAAGQAQVEAQRIRDATKKQQSASIAALAASGVDVGAGTAEQITTDIGQKGEQDALTTILNGRNGVSRAAANADALRISGSNAQTAGYLNATSSVLNGASVVGSKWAGIKTKAPAVAGGT